MSKTANEGIKAALSLYHIGYDEICRRLGITEKRFTWLMEKEFTKSMRQKVTNAIEAIKKEDGL